MSAQAGFALRGRNPDVLTCIEDASLRYTGIESHEGLSHHGLYDTVLARE